MRKGIPLCLFLRLRRGVNSGQSLPPSFSSFPSSLSPPLLLPRLSSLFLISFLPFLLPPSLDLSFPSSSPEASSHIYLPDALLGTGDKKAAILEQQLNSCTQLSQLPCQALHALLTCILACVIVYKNLLSTYCMPGTIPDTEMFTAVNTTDKLPALGPFVL